MTRDEQEQAATRSFLDHAAMLACYADDYPTARDLLNECLAIQRTLGLAAALPVTSPTSHRSPGSREALVGHVASLTVALGRLCALGSGVLGTALPHARPFLVEWDGRAWRCTASPAMSPIA